MKAARTISPARRRNSAGAAPKTAEPKAQPSALFYCAAYLLPLMTVLGQRAGYPWFNVVFTFGLLPLLDLALPVDKANLPKSEERRVEKLLRFRVLLWAWVPMQLALLWWACRLAPTLDAWSFVWLALSAGVVGGNSITVAHELGHKRVWFERALGELLLCTQSYGHFQIEHVQGHHWHVATPADPASARLGEPFPRFWVRSVVGSFLSALRIDRGRVLSYVAAELAMGCAVGAACGAAGAAFFAAQGVVGFTLLEAVNYLEHYGLQRKQLPDGSYEPVTPLHSWNADNTVSDAVLFRLGRHSDHHAFPTRRYQILRSFPESPNLPSGYAGLIPIVLVPPLWFALMDHRVIEHRRRVAALAPPAYPLSESE